MNQSPALRLACATLGLLALLAGPAAHAQTAPPPAEADSSVATPPKSLARFDLDFPGGTPPELIAAITKAAKQPVNVIISEAHARIPLPALRLRDVNVPTLFRAIGEATASMNPVTANTASRLRFLTEDEASSPGAIWYSRVFGTEPITRFYSLAYYLQQGLTVDDITTAVRTGWEMRGDKETPALKFHPETQILIAFGQPEQLAVIADVLKVLEPTVAIRAQSTVEAAPKPTAAEKAERAAELRRKQAIPPAAEAPRP